MSTNGMKICLTCVGGIHTSMLSFILAFWPGHLCIAGDANFSLRKQDVQRVFEIVRLTFKENKHKNERLLIGGWVGGVGGKQYV